MRHGFGTNVASLLFAWLLSLANAHANEVATEPYTLPNTEVHELQSATNNANFGSLAANSSVSG